LSKSSSSKSKSVTYRNDKISLIDGVVAEGDAGGVFTAANRGGNDTFLGASGQENIAFGETTGAMSGGARGGDDKFFGGDDAFNLFVGDASSLSGKGTRGGDDTFRGGDALGTPAAPVSLADSDGYALNVAFGDASGYGVPTLDPSIAPADLSAASLLGALGALNVGLADTSSGLLNGARGGDDKLYGGDVGADGYAVLNLLVGDADFIGESTPVVPGSIGGKSCDKSQDAQGGDDKLYGGSVLEDGYAINLMAGDAFVIDVGGRGGDDRLVGGDGNLDGYGATPVGSLDSSGPSIAINLLLGDALLMNGVAGDDKVQGGDGAINLLLGDGYAAGADATNGDDVLVSGENSFFLMLGDSLDGYGSDPTVAGPPTALAGGEDRFVIESGSVGAILDFSLADGDKIDLSRLFDHDDDHDDDDDCDDDSDDLSAEMIALLETIIVDSIGDESSGGSALIDFSLADASYGLGSGSVLVVGTTEAELEANLWQVFIV
jgi:hypothetical protein